MSDKPDRTPEELLMLAEKLSNALMLVGISQTSIHSESPGTSETRSQKLSEALRDSQGMGFTSPSGFTLYGISLLVD